MKKRRREKNKRLNSCIAFDLCVLASPTGREQGHLSALIQRIQTSYNDSITTKHVVSIARWMPLPLQLPMPMPMPLLKLQAHSFIHSPQICKRSIALTPTRMLKYDRYALLSSRVAKCRLRWTGQRRRSNSTMQPRAREGPWLRVNARQKLCTTRQYE